MFGAGIKLMLVGMLVVVVFLLMMIFFIQLIEIFTRSHTRIEFQKKQKVPLNKKAVDETCLPVVVFSAAIDAYESERRLMKINN